MTAAQRSMRDQQSERRWFVHIGLIASFGIALAVIVARMGTTVHVLAGLCWAGLVGVHLAQRRRTVTALAPDLVRPVRWRSRRGRLALSATVLAFLAVNVVASGIVVWITGRTVMLPVHEVGIPLPDLNWHSSTSLLLVIYLIVHVVRRAARLRSSHIR